MPPHLHPRSRSTTSLFTATLLASFVIVGMPHLFPCPAPRRTLADSEATISPDGQRIIRRRRRKEIEQTNTFEGTISHDHHPHPNHRHQELDEELVKFRQMEEEADRMAKVGRECPVPKPGGLVGEILGFKQREKD